MAFPKLIPGFQKVADFPSESYERFAGRVPEAILPIWNEQGLGMSGDGFIKVIDPVRYLDELGDCLPVEGTVPLFATGLGDVICFAGDITLNVMFRYGDVAGMSSRLKGFAQFSSEPEYEEDQLRYLPYPQAVDMYGPLAYDECFCFTPLLALGGPERPENLQKGDLITHVQLITQLTGVIEWG